MLMMMRGKHEGGRITTFSDNLYRQRDFETSLRMIERVIEPCYILFDVMVYI